MEESFSPLLSTLDSGLEKVSVTRSEFSELMIRLLDYGVIDRNESHIEAQYYDRYVRCQEWVEDYLRVIGVRLLHDAQFRFIRVFPPGATVPGLPDDEHAPFKNGFRRKLSQQEVAAILVLRVEYEKSLREGQLDDKGCVMLSLEGFSLALKNLLKKGLPENLLERRQIFRHLKQLRLIDLNAELDVESADSWISIHPAITRFVNDDVLAQLYPDAQAEAGNEHVL